MPSSFEMDPDPEDDYVGKVARALVEERGGGSIPRSPLTRAHLKDILPHLRAFGRDASARSSLPCLVFDNEPPLPINIDSRRKVRRFVVPGAREQELDVTDAEAGLVNRLTRFLRWRRPSRYGPPPSPGLSVRISTRRANGRVFYTPAYYFRLDQAFGYPTTPVSRLLRPGVYRFGVEYSVGTIKWDSAEYDIPPNLNIKVPV